MRLATFNVENMFERPSIMNLSSWEKGKPVLEDFSRLNDLIQKPIYSETDKQEMLDIMKRKRNAGLLELSQESKYMWLRVIRGKLIKRPKNAPKEIVANGRNDWIGWFELKTEDIKEVAIENTGRVIREVDADVFCVVEVDDRIALKRFNDSVIPKIKVKKYNHVMLIDGNDDRGIDLGVMTREWFEIESIVSHVDDPDEKNEDERIFSRDCPEYTIKTPAGNRLLVLINHFKSKGYGNPKVSNSKRMRQAERVKQIYSDRLKQGFEFIAIVGDLNDTPGSPPMQPLLGNELGLTDIMTHGKFVGDGRVGTYGDGYANNKIDYILMSPKLANKVIAGGIERRGVWGGKKGKLFPHFDEIKSAKDAASDHAALWVDLDL
jgi:endonuclease/exonuclease/phosphatase family metal-dependent hydrolase